MTDSDGSTADSTAPRANSTIDSSAAKVVPEKKVTPRSGEKKIGEVKPAENKVVKLLEKNQLGMTLPEMAGGPRQMKKIRTLRPLLAESIRSGLVMPISQRAGHTVYRLVKYLGPR